MQITHTGGFDPHLRFACGDRPAAGRHPATVRVCQRSQNQGCITLGSLLRLGIFSPDCRLEWTEKMAKQRTEWNLDRETHSLVSHWRGPLSYGPGLACTERMREGPPSSHSERLGARARRSGGGGERGGTSRMRTAIASCRPDSAESGATECAVTCWSKQHPLCSALLVEPWLS